MESVNAGFDPLSQMLNTSQTESPKEEASESTSSSASPTKPAAVSSSPSKMDLIGGDFLKSKSDEKQKVKSNQTRMKMSRAPPATSKKQSVIWNTSVDAQTVLVRERVASERNELENEAVTQKIQAKIAAKPNQEEKTVEEYGVPFDPATAGLPKVSEDIQQLMLDDWDLNWEDPDKHLAGEMLLINIANVYLLKNGRRFEGNLVVTFYQLYFYPMRHSTKRVDASKLNKIPLGSVDQLIGTVLKQQKKPTRNISLQRSQHKQVSRIQEAAICCTLEILGKNMQALKLGFVSPKVYERVHLTLQKSVFPQSNELLFTFAYKLPIPESVKAAHERMLQNLPADAKAPEPLGKYWSIPDHLNGWKLYNAKEEFARMGLPNRHFRLYTKNNLFKISPTYPSLFVVPNAKLCSDDDILEICKFRSRARLPVLTWKHPSGPQTLWRCSQPRAGVKQNRCLEDEDLFTTIMQVNPMSNSLVIFDARPKINAVGNKMAGKGYENTDFYRNCTIRFMDIENIHVMRGSMQRLRAACKSNEHDRNFFSIVGSSGWYTHVSIVLQAVFEMVQSIDRDKQSVVSHCSDGWDRTAQLTSLSQLCLDPYFRTLRGFMILIEKEFISYGHKFAQRLGVRDKNNEDQERSPVFLQFLDCVYQLTIQFPSHFEFNSLFLHTIAHHMVTCRFASFLYNNERDRVRARASTTAMSIWTYMMCSPAAQSGKFSNPMYGYIGNGTGRSLSEAKAASPTQGRPLVLKQQGAVIYPMSSLKRLQIWRDYWLQDEDIFDYIHHEGSDEKNSLTSKGLFGSGTVFPFGSAITDYGNFERIQSARLLEAENQQKELKKQLAASQEECARLAAQLTSLQNSETDEVKQEQVPTAVEQDDDLSSDEDAMDMGAALSTANLVDLVEEGDEDAVDVASLLATYGDENEIDDEAV